MIPYFQIPKIKANLSLTAMRSLANALASGGLYTKKIPEGFVSPEEEERIGGFSSRKVFKIGYRGGVTIGPHSGFIETYNKKDNILFKAEGIFEDRPVLVITFKEDQFVKYYDDKARLILRDNINMSYWGYERLPRILSYGFEDKYYNFGFSDNGELIHGGRYETTGEDMYTGIRYQLFMFEVVQGYKEPQPQNTWSRSARVSITELQQEVYGQDSGYFEGYFGRYWLPKMFRGGRYWSKNRDVWYDFKTKEFKK